MNVQMNRVGVSTYARSQDKPAAAPPSSPAGPVDSAVISGAAPCMGLLDRVGFGLVTSTAHLAGTSLAPAAISGPAAAATHAANVALLDGLRSKGITVYRRRRIVFQWFRPVDAEKAAKLLEKRDKANDPTKGPLFLNMGSDTGVPLSSSTDLRLLDALEGSGDPTGVGDPPLARALHELGKSGFRFDAEVGAQWVVKGDRDDDSRVPVGTVGAYKMLAEKLQGFERLNVSGSSPVAVESREAMLALNFFTNSGTPAGLADAELATGMRRVDARYPVNGERGGGVMKTYLAQVEKDVDKREARVAVSSDCHVPVTRAELVDSHTLLDVLDQLRARLDRMGTVDRRAAVEVLTSLRKSGRLDDDHEKAFMTLGALDRGYDSRLSTVYGAVTGAAMAGESASHAAEAFGELSRTEFPKKTEQAADAFVFLRTRFDDLKGSVAGDVKAARFVKLVRLFGTSKEAVGAWDALGAGSAAADAFDAGHAATQRLGGHSAADGLKLYQAVRAEMVDGESLSDALDVMSRISRALARGWGGVESTSSTFRFAWTGLKTHGPADMPMPDRRERFLTLLERFKDERIATRAWSLLEGAPSTAAFDDGVCALGRLSDGLQRNDDLLGVFTALGDRTRAQGGFSGAEGQRWLHLVEATGSWQGAQTASDMLDRLPAEVPADARVALLQGLAQANGKDLARTEDDLAFLQRFAETPSAMPGAGERYARLLAASGGRPAEARQAMAMMDGYLAQDGPSGLSAAQRQTLHGRLLGSGLDNSGAHVFLRGLEACSQDGGTAETAVTALEQLARAGAEQRSRSPLGDAMAVWQAVADRTSDAAERAATLAAAAQAVSKARIPLGFLTEKVLALPTLDDVRTGCAQLLELSDLGKDMVDVWPAMSPVVERVGWTRAMEGARAFGTDARGLSAVFGALAKTPDCDGELPKAMKWAGIIGKRVGAEAGLTTYRAVRRWADGLDWNGGTDARVDRWCETVASTSRHEGMLAALNLLSVPNGRESLETREKALQAVVSTLPDDARRWSSAAEVYGVVATGALRGDDLVENAAQTGALLGLRLTCEQAGQVYLKLQRDRAAGGRFEHAPLADLVTSFGEQYNTSHATEADRAAAERLFRGQSRDASGNAIEAALDRMHGATGRLVETIQHDDQGVLIGGIRVSKRS